jgi:hypothetical protein
MSGIRLLVHFRESEDRGGVQRVGSREGDAELAAVAALPAGEGVGPKPRQRGGGEGKAEEQQRGARGEADRHAYALDSKCRMPAIQTQSAINTSVRSPNSRQPSNQSCRRWVIIRSPPSM